VVFGVGGKEDHEFLRMMMTATTTMNTGWMSGWKVDFVLTWVCL
jgi:hypothetical protein